MSDVRPSDGTTFDLDAELAQLGLRPAVLILWCEVSRATVWKWRRRQLPVPAYVRSLIHKQRIINRLMGTLSERTSM